MFVNLRVFSLLLVSMAMMAFSSPAWAWGALAIDGDKGNAYGWAINHGTLTEAQDRAMKECGSDKCFVVMVFEGGAAAYAVDATGGSSIYGWGRAETGSEARKIAEAEVRKRGGTKVVVRAWGEEKKNLTKAAKDVGPRKAFVQLRLALDRDPAGTGTWANFVGWTDITPEEYMQYGIINTSMLYSKQVLGNPVDASYLVTAGIKAPSLSRLEDSPVMQRFVAQHVEPHRLYSERNKSAFNDGVTKKYDDGFFYEGRIILMDGTVSYDDLKNVTFSFENKTGGYDVIDVGRF